MKFAVIKRTAGVELLENRRLLSGIPYSQTLADSLVANIAVANNNYSYTTTPSITWTGINSATVYSNISDCSNFETLLIEQAYGYTSAQIKGWTGYTLPQASDYYAAAVNDSGFTGFYQISAVQVGDVMFFDYANDPDGTGDTGHAVTIDALPVYTGLNSLGTEREYNLTVVDCTVDPHSNDTRQNDPNGGVGRGTMRMYTDLSGNLVAYSWGLSSESVVYPQSLRASIFAKLPPAPSAAWLAAGSQAVYNSSANTLAVNGPATIIADPTSSYQPAVTVSGSGSQLIIMDGLSSTMHLTSLSLTSGATATVYDPNNWQTVLDIAANVGNGVVSVDSTSTLDLQGNDMLVHGGSISAISSLIARGYDNGLWAGTGITSSAAASNTTHLTTLGAILNTNSTGTGSLYTSFDGKNTSQGDVLVKYTFYGDANLDGKVDGSDYSLIDNGFLHRTTLTGWYNGDFNDSSSINGSDYTLIDNAFNTQGLAIVFSPSSLIANANPPVKIAQASLDKAIATAATPADSDTDGLTTDRLKKSKRSQNTWRPVDVIE